MGIRTLHGVVHAYTYVRLDRLWSVYKRIPRNPHKPAPAVRLDVVSSSEILKILVAARVAAPSLLSSALLSQCLRFLSSVPCQVCLALAKTFVDPTDTLGHW